MQMVTLLSEIYSQVGIMTKISERMVLTLKVQDGEKGCCCWMHSVPISIVLVLVFTGRLRLPLLVCFGFCFIVYSWVFYALEW